MKGKVLKPHPNRSCDLIQLSCQNLWQAGRLPGGAEGARRSSGMGRSLEPYQDMGAAGGIGWDGMGCLPA